MAKTFLLLVSIGWAGVCLASVQTLVPTDCSLVIKNGRGKGCCTGQGQDPFYGNPCQGDLTYPLCQAPQILDLTSPEGGIFGGTEEVSTGVQCATGCSFTKKRYHYYCCKCPNEYTYVPGKVDCNEQVYPGDCAKCSDPSETLKVGSSIQDTTCEAGGGAGGCSASGGTTTRAQATGKQVQCADSAGNPIKKTVSCGSSNGNAQPKPFKNPRKPTELEQCCRNAFNVDICKACNKFNCCASSKNQCQAELNVDREVAKRQETDCLKGLSARC